MLPYRTLLPLLQEGGVLCLSLCLPIGTLQHVGLLLLPPLVASASGLPKLLAQTTLMSLLRQHPCQV